MASEGALTPCLRQHGHDQWSIFLDSPRTTTNLESYTSKVLLVCDASTTTTDQPSQIASSSKTPKSAPKKGYASEFRKSLIQAESKEIEIIELNSGTTSVNVKSNVLYEIRNYPSSALELFPITCKSHSNSLKMRWRNADGQFKSAICTGSKSCAVEGCQFTSHNQGKRWKEHRTNLELKVSCECRIFMGDVPGLQTKLVFFLGDHSHAIPTQFKISEVTRQKLMVAIGVMPNFSVKDAHATNGFLSEGGEAMMNPDRLAMNIRKIKRVVYGNTGWKDIESAYLSAPDQSDYVRKFNITDPFKFIFCQTNYAVSLSSKSKSFWMDLHYPG